VLLIDAAKGTVAVRLLGPFAGPQAWMPYLVGTAAVIGHVYTVFLGFKGGKGVATAAGVMLGIAPLAIGLTLGVWLIVVLLSGYVSLGSLLASASFTPIAIFTHADRYTIIAGLLLTSLLWYTHRANIGRLLAGTEARFSRSKSKREG
jgi:glycerol-3-phosphate acyltransferase PlsY